MYEIVEHYHCPASTDGRVNGTTTFSADVTAAYLGSAATVRCPACGSFVLVAGDDDDDDAVQA